MRSLTITVLFFIAVTFMRAPCEAGWLIYHKPEFKGKVIDAETNEPIEGAVVVVSYGKVTMGLGAGANSSIIDVRETMTDKEGRFIIPSYTTFIQPFSWEWRAMFTIYKPGFANVEGKDLEGAFSNGMIKEYESPWHFKYPNIKFRISQGVVALPKLRTREERLKAFPSIPGPGVPGNKMKLLIQLYNEESRFLGLSGETYIP